MLRISYTFRVYTFVYTKLAPRKLLPHSKEIDHVAQSCASPAYSRAYFLRKYKTKNIILDIYKTEKF